MTNICEICESEFATEKDFKDHFNLLHVNIVSFSTIGGSQYLFSRSSDGFFRCPTCSSSIRSADSLFDHIRCIYEIPSYKLALNAYKRVKQDWRDYPIENNSETHELSAIETPAVSHMKIYWNIVIFFFSFVQDFW